MLRGNFACFPHALNEKPLANSSCKLPFSIEYLNNEKSRWSTEQQSPFVCVDNNATGLSAVTTSTSANFALLVLSRLIPNNDKPDHPIRVSFISKLSNTECRMRLPFCIVWKKIAPCSLTAEKTFLTAKWKTLWKCDHENVAGIACHNVQFKQKRSNNNKSKAAVRQNITATNKVWTCELKTSID